MVAAAVPAAASESGRLWDLLLERTRKIHEKGTPENASIGAAASTADSAAQSVSEPLPEPVAEMESLQIAAGDVSEFNGTWNAVKLHVSD